MLLCIQSKLNNTSSSTTGKTPNKIAYGFSSRRSLDLFSNPLLPNRFQTHTDMTNAISFAFANQKAHYDRKHQPLFMKVGDWAMLRLYKDYSIPSSVGVTKKLTQQYVCPFHVLEKMGRLTYKLDVSLNWGAHLVFSVAQLELASFLTNNPFHYPRPYMPPIVFVDDDTNTAKSFEVDRLLHKRTVKKGKGHTVEYLVCWTGYGPE